MRAIYIHQFGGPEVLRMEEIPSLTVGPGQILIRIKAVGVNPVDTYIREGLYHLPIQFPFTCGFDAAGIIEDLGSDVRGWSIGDRVFMGGSLSGAYAEQALCRADQILSLPDHISFAQGAAVGIPYAAAYRALFAKARLAPGETLLIHGASGGVGCAALQFARKAQAVIFATAGSPAGRELVKNQGAARVFDHTDPQHIEAIRAATKGRGVNVILEMLANVNLAKDLETLVALSGRIIVIGSRGRVEIDPRHMMMRDALVMGMLMMNMPDDERATTYASIVDGLRRRELEPVVGKKFPLAEARQAHEAVRQLGACGKIVLIP